jgi:CBS domain-containing protein
MVKRFPVVNDKGRLLGIVSRVDIVRALGKE